MGVPAQLQWTLKKIQLFAITNDLVGEHEAIQQFKKLALFPSEQHQSRLFEASLYFRSGNFKRFAELLEQVNQETLPDSKSKAQYHLLSSHKNEIEGNYAAAKSELECLLENDANGEHNTSTYNNLARLEEIQGNELQAVHYYEKALDLLRKHPEANLYQVVYYNLIVYKARTGKTSDAKALLEEYRAAVDTRIDHQYLEYLNTQITLARQIKDGPMLLQGYGMVDLYIKPKLTKDEWMAQFVSELRMRANDGIGIHEHLFKTELLFDDLTSQPFPKSYFALKELFGVLKQLAKDNQLGPMDSLFKRTLSALSEVAPKIDAYRKSIPDALLNQHFFWISEINFLHKLTSVTPDCFNQTFFDILFGQLKELIRISADKNNHRLQMQALMILCDEYSAYSPYINSPLDADYRQLARQSLEDANHLLQSRIEDPALHQYMAGLAWCEWKINTNAASATYWINQFESKKFSQLHFAVWHRQQYEEVKNWLNPHGISGTVR
jgi:tetratricopeptide (TPR) repeat protein